MVLGRNNFIKSLLLKFLSIINVLLVNSYHFLKIKNWIFFKISNVNEDFFYKNINIIFMIEFKKYITNLVFFILL